MRKRLWLSVTMLVAGVGLLVAASFASASGNAHQGQALKKGGIWRYGTVGGLSHMDPQLAYVTSEWFLEYATAAKLYNYPDKAGPRGSKLVPEVASKITMPLFQATSTKLPLNKEVTTVKNIRTIPSAGPYAVSYYDPAQLVSVRRNPYYKKGPGRSRPHNLAGLDMQLNLNDQTVFNQTLANQLDEMQPVPPAEIAGLRSKYGINKSRFWAQPLNCTGYLPMNTARSLFGGNTKLRQAINYAIARKDYVNQAGPGGGRPWTHLFNPTVPGWRNVTVYPLTPSLAKAKALAKGHFKSGKINVGYRSSGSINPNQAQIVRRDLVRLGFKPNDINMKGYNGTTIYDVMGKKGTDLDIGVSMGWCSDYPDPYDWLNVLLYGGAIQAENNNNYSYFNDPKWNRKLVKASGLVGPKRYKAYGQLDLSIMKQAAPVAAERTYNNQYVFSNRINPKSLIYQAVYQDWSIPALALK